MPRKAGPGRPRLTDAQAWNSLRDRFERYYEQRLDTDHLIWTGPETLDIAGDRGTITPRNFMLAEMGYDISLYKIVGTTCGVRKCVNPLHQIVTKLESKNLSPSWVPSPLPDLPKRRPDHRPELYPSMA